MKLSYSVNIVTDSGLGALLKKTKDYLDDYWPVVTSVGEPIYFCDLDKTTISLAPTPNANYPVVFTFAKDNPYLTSNNPTNNIIEYYPDLLFNACLVEQARFSRMYEAMQIYEQMYQQRLQGIQRETDRERSDNTAPRHIAQIDENRK